MKASELTDTSMQNEGLVMTDTRFPANRVVEHQKTHILVNRLLVVCVSR